MKTTTSLRVMTYSDLLNQPGHEWLVPSVIPLRALSCIYGSTGTTKTFLALDLVAACAAGQSWLTLNTRPSKAIYIAFEGNLRDRVAAVAQKRRMSQADLDSIRWVDASLINLCTEVHREALRQAVGEIVGRWPQDAPVLVVIDTLAASMAGGDENSSVGMGVVVGALRGLITEFGCTVLLIHHTGKDSSRGMRGNSLLECGVDAVLALRKCESRRSQDTPYKRFCMTGEKLRDGDSGFRIEYLLRETDVVDAAGNAIATCVIDENVEAPGPHQATSRRTHGNRNDQHGSDAKRIITLLQATPESSGPSRLRIVRNQFIESHRSRGVSASTAATYWQRGLRELRDKQLLKEERGCLLMSSEVA